MVKGIITKILDNLQAVVSNVHVRIESPNAGFSLGVVLKQLTFFTTDKEWQKRYLDRTMPEHADSPLHKLLCVKGFAIYYKIAETNFIHQLPSAAMLASFSELFKSSESGKIAIYESDYLLQPIQLQVKMIQYDAELALKLRAPAFFVDIQLESFGICLQKVQYANFQQLFELANDYVRFRQTAALERQKMDLKIMYDMLGEQQAQDVFAHLYAGQLRVVVRNGLDDKKREGLQKDLKHDLGNNLQLYQQILRAIDTSVLEGWASGVVSDLATQFKQQKAQKKKWSFFQDNKADKQLVPSDVVLQLETKVCQQLALEQSVEFAKQMQSVPWLEMRFNLASLIITLQHNTQSALQLYNKQFAVDLSLFDSDNYNKHKLSLRITNQAFGIDVLQDQLKTPFIKQRHQQTALDLHLQLGNGNNKASNDYFDLDLQLKVQPIIVIYQAMQIKALTKFFKAKHLNDRTRQAAMQQLEGLSKQVKGLSKAIETDFLKNNITVQIDAPCLVVPFQQQSQQAIDASECWIFTLGDAQFSSADGTSSTHEVYQLQVSGVKFEYCDCFTNIAANPVPIIHNFTTTVMISSQRGTDVIEVVATFDKNVQLQLTPSLLLKLCDIGTLFIPDPKLSYIHKLNKRHLQNQQPVLQPPTLEDKDYKKVNVIVTAPFFSLELRDQQGLIFEVCIVSMEFQFEQFESRRKVLNIQAGTLLLLHNEISQNKQIMLGHLDAKYNVLTNSDFYDQLPKEFTGDNRMIRISIQFCPNGDMDMFLAMNKVKMYARQQELMNISKHIILFLEKIDSTYPPSIDDPTINPATKKIQLHFSEMLLIMENQKNRCVVLEVTSDILVKILDQWTVKQGLSPGMQKTYNQTKVDVQSVKAYFCDLNDIALHGLGQTKKLEVLQPLQFDLDLEISLKHDQIFQVCKNIEMQLEQVVLKLSMHDLYVFQSIAMSQIRDILMLQDVWVKYTDISDEIKLKFQSKLAWQDQLAIDPEQIAIDIQCNNAEVLIIDEHDGGYVPLFFGNLNDFTFTKQGNDCQSQTLISLRVGLDYFNANASFYEPAIESFPVVLDMTTVNASQDTIIKLSKPVNVNFTISLATCIANFEKLWTESKLNTNRLNESTINQIPDSEQQIASTEMQLEKLAVSDFNYGDSMISDSQRILSNEEQSISSPHAIRNATNQPIYFYILNKQGAIQSYNAQRIEPQQVKMIAQNKINELDKGTQMDLFVKLAFVELYMQPVSWFNLNINNTMMLHNVYKSKNEHLQPREHFVLHSQLENNKRVLTVRTLYMLKNLTKVAYYVKIFHQESQQVVIDAEIKLMPEQSMSLPDHLDLAIQNQVKIAIRPQKCRKWSQEFKLQAIKDKIVPELNIVWQHHETYSILRKVRTLHPSVFDFVLLPPLILKNCLPCQLRIQICGQSVNLNESYNNLLELSKQEERYVQDIQKQTDKLILSLQVGQYLPTEIDLLPDQSQETDLKIRFTDNRGRFSTAIARIETKRAGLSVLFYFENVLICQTIEPVIFYYQKRAGVFEKNNANQLAEPLTEEPQNVVYAIESVKELFATTQQSDQCARLSLLAGNIGDFQVGNNKTQYNFAFETELFSVCKLLSNLQRILS